MNGLFGLGIVGVLLLVAVAVGIGALLWMRTRYRTVPSNEALVITGPKLGDEKKEKNIHRDAEGRYMKIVRGGGHRLRMFQTATRVKLDSFQLSLETPKVYTQQGVGIFATAVAQVKVSGELQGIVQYAEQFLGKKQDEIQEEVRQVLSSNLRAILAGLTVEQINNDMQGFNERVRKVAQTQLERMGFEITSLNLSDLWDEEGYLDNLGRPQAAKVKEIADIKESESRRVTQMKVAEDNEAIQREQYKREMSVSNDKRDKDLLDADNESQTNKAKATAEAAGELEREQRKLEIKEQQLEIEELERKTQLHLKMLERENDVAIEEQQVKVRKQQVDAENYEKREVAKAEAESIIEKSKAEAESTRLKGEAEADAIKMKADALAEHGEAILQELMIRTLPEFARASTEYMSNIESIRVWDSGGNGSNGGSLKNLLDNPISTMANIQEQSQQMTGVPLTGLLGKILGTGEVVREYDKEDGEESVNKVDETSKQEQEETEDNRKVEDFI